MPVRFSLVDLLSQSCLLASKWDQTFIGIMISAWQLHCMWTNLQWIPPTLNSPIVTKLMPLQIEALKMSKETLAIPTRSKFWQNPFCVFIVSLWVKEVYHGVSQCTAHVPRLCPSLIGGVTNWLVYNTGWYKRWCVPATLIATNPMMQANTSLRMESTEVLQLKLLADQSSSFPWCSLWQ